jgi:enamine deaminase RidA (YjgF/YER057c/UK114 family)
MQHQDPPHNVNPPDLAPARGFAHATIAGATVWIGGQNGSDATGKIVDLGDIVGQFARSIRNVATALRAAGCAPENTVRLTYYVTDLNAYRANLKAIGFAYREVFGRHYPATTLIEVHGLFDADALVEIDAVAARRA